MAARQFLRDPGRPSKSHDERKKQDERDYTSWTGFTGFAKLKDFSMSRSGGTLKKSPSKLELRRQTIQSRSKARERRELEKLNPLSKSDTTKDAGMLPILNEDHEEDSTAPVSPNVAATPTVFESSSSQRILYAEPQSLLAKRPHQELIDIILSLRKENAKLRITHGTVIPQRKTSATVGASGFVDRGLELRLLAATKELDRLRAELQEEKSKVSQAEKHKNITLRKMAEMTKMEGNLYDDRHFCEEVEQLRITLSEWCGHQTWQVGDLSRQSPNPTRHHFRSVFKGTCRRLSDYTESHSKVSLLVEAYVWEFLVYEVFGKYLWAEQGKEQSIAKSLRGWSDYMHQIIQVDEEQHKQVFHEYRVASARIIALRDPAVAEPHILEAVKEKTQALDKDLSVFACRTLDVESLDEIFMSAVKLDSQMEQQRPKFEFSPLFTDLSHGRNLSFNKAEMETLTEDNSMRQGDKREVILVRRPGLWKLGNAAGKDYGRQICILPTIVDLDSR